MAFDAHADLATATIATAPSPATSGTSLVVQSGQGAWFPATPFYATAWPPNTLPTLANSEIVRVTNVATNTFTITRAQASTSAQAIAVGWQIANSVTAEDIRTIEGQTNGPRTVLEPGNLGATYTVNFAGAEQEIWVEGTLDANCTVTFTNRVAGCKGLLLVTQDAVTGNWTLNVSDGVTSTPVGINATTGTMTAVEVDCPDSSTVIAVASGGVLLAGDLGGTSASPVVETVLAGKTPAVLDSTGHLTPTEAQVASLLKTAPAVRPLKRDLLILDNGGTYSTSNSTQILAEQFIPDLTTGAMYMTYFGNGSSFNVVCLAKASGTRNAPASPDPTINSFTDLGPILVSGVKINGDAVHIIVANNTYFLFVAQNTSQGAVIYCYHAPQITSGAIVPLESAVWANASNSCYPGAQNVGSLTPTTGTGGSLPSSLQTLVVTALDHDTLESGTTTVTSTPPASGTVVLTWTAPATGETNGYYVYRNGGRIATVAHGTLTYTVTGAEALGVAPPPYTSSSCTRLDEPYVFYNPNSGYWEMLVMGMNAASTMEQVHLARVASPGISTLTTGSFQFIKQNNTQPVIPAGNYAAVFGTSIPGNASNATLYDYEVAADPWALVVGNQTVIGYSAGPQGSIADTNIYRIALAVTSNTAAPAGYTKLGVMHHPSAAKNPADATNGAALDGRGQNRAACASWRGSMYVDANGIGHMPRCAKLANGSDHTQAYYYQYDLSGLTDVINGLRLLDPWVRVEAESTDVRMALTGFASTTAAEVYFSGGAINGSGGKARYTTNATDAITFTFLGSAVRVGIGRVLTTGTVTITLDGGGTEGVNQFSNLDMTSDVAGTFTVVFAAQFDSLNPGVHQLTVVADTTGSSGMYIDFFDYIPMPGLSA